MMNDSVNPNHIGDDSVASTRMTTQSTPPPPPPSLAPKTAHQTSLGHRLQRALTGGPNHRFPGLHSPPGAAAPSLLLRKRLTYPLFALAALLAAFAVLLAASPVWGQATECVSSDTTICYEEHTPVETPVATFTATDDEDDKAGEALTWSVTGADAAFFDISQAGVLTFKNSPDYENAKGGQATEAANTYNIDVTATDSDEGDTDHAVVVMVTNKDEPATLTLSNRQPVDGVSITATLTDEDGAVSNQDWQWARGSSRTGSFTDIEATTGGNANGAETATYTPGPDDIGQYLRLTVGYTDPEGSGKEEPVVSDYRVLAARSSNAAPVIVDSEGDEITETTITREVDENSAAGTPVGGPILVSNVESDVLTFKLSGTDGDKFVIDSNGQITVGAGTDLDTEDNDNDSFTVTVTVEDGNFRNSNTETDYSDTIDVTITAENVEEDPELDGETSVEHAENTAIATAVATYMVTDDEDDNANTPVDVELSGTDADAFTLTDTSDAGGTPDDGTWELALKELPDFEAPADVGRDNTYNITVTAEDSSDRTHVLNVAVTVANVEEDGTVELSTLAPKVGVELTATLTGDEDGATSGVTWKWERADNSAFGDGDNVTKIEGATSAAYTPVHADSTKYLRATAMYTDPEGEDSASVVSENMVVGSNRAPAFADVESTTEVDESMNREIEQLEGEFTSNMNMGAAVAAVDPDSGETAQLTYDLSGDAAPFDINRSSGQLLIRSGTTLDHETKDSYVVMVTAADPGGLSATVTVTIKVTNVEEDPVIAGDDSPQYEEHTPVETPVATFTATDDEDDKAGEALTWSVTGADAAFFDISQAGVLTFKNSPDYENAKGGQATEAANTYNIDVTATDSDEGDTDHAVVVMVTNKDEPATLTLSNRQPVDGVSITATLTDEDGAVSNQDWQWARGSSRTGSFTDIEATTGGNANGAETATYTPGPDDIGQYLRLTVGYTDPEGSGKEEPVVSDYRVLATRSSNAAPVIVDSEGDEITETTITREVDENSAAGTPVGGPILVSNAESDVLTFKLSGTDGDKFVIDSNGQITVGAGTDLDTEDNDNDSFTVTVTVEDGNFRNSNTETDYSDTIDVTITAENVEEDPELDGETSVEHAENTAIATAVATYMVTDDEDDNANTPVDVELSGTDADAFTLTDTSDAGGTPDDGTWELALKELPDFEAPADVGRDNTYNITVTAEDSSDRTHVLNVAVTVANVEEDGTVVLSTLVPKVGVELTATLTGDEDGATSGVTWKWERADNSAFGDGDNVTKIEGATSVAYTPVHADSTKYLRATAMYTDPEGEDSASVVSENMVVGSNRAPAFADVESTTEVDESMNREIEQLEGEFTSNMNMGAAVAAVDPDSGETALLTYALSGDAAPFDINRSSGQLLIRSGTTLDHETKDSYVVMVTATDPDGASASVTVTIKVDNVNENPVVMRADSVTPNQAPVAPTVANQTATEDTAFSYTVPAFTDPEGGTITYTATLSDDSALPGWLSFNASTRELSGTPLEADTPASLTIEVSATDDGSPSASAQVTFTITVTDVNEAPVAPTVANQTATKDTAFSYTVPAFTDPEGDTITYTATLSDDSALPGWLSFNASTRELSGTPLEADTPASLTIEVSATDDGSPSASAQVTFTITVTDVNEAPVAPTVANQTATKDTAFSYTVPAFTDPEGDTITYTATLSDDSALPGWLSFNASTRELSGTPLEADTPASLTIEVSATDDGSPSASAQVTFTLTVGEEAPTTLLVRYDADEDGWIQLQEARVAVGDHFGPPKGVKLSLDDTRKVVGLYFEYKNRQ